MSGMHPAFGGAPQWRVVGEIPADQGWAHVEDVMMGDYLLGMWLHLHDSELPHDDPRNNDACMIAKVYAWTLDPDTVYFWRGIKMDVKGECNGNAPFTRG